MANVTCYKQNIIFKKYNIKGRNMAEVARMRKERQFAQACEHEQLYCDDGRRAINCNKEGKICKYHTKNSEWKCNYIGMEKHMRGCDPCMCTKWQLKVCTPELCNKFDTEVCNKECCKLWNWRTEKAKERRKSNVAQDKSKQSEYVSDTV
jgi:hypothetical protein